MLSPTYVSSYKVFSWNTKTSSGRVLIKKSERRFLHHIVSADRYYESTTEQLDTVIVVDDNVQAFASLENSEVSLWRTNVFVFVVVNWIHAEGEECRPQKKFGCTFCELSEKD